MQTDVRRIAWLAAPVAALFAALAVSGPAHATPTPGGATSYVPTQDPGAMTQGIIMRDGGICNPRWGC
jgi:hypothetical protein